jgi:hypothetical protein
MMEVNSAVMILMAEILAVTLFAVAGLLYFLRKQRHAEMQEIERFVDKCTTEETLRIHNLKSILREKCQLDQEATEAVLKEIIMAERAIIQRVVTIILQRDMSQLHDLDGLVSSVSNPLCNLLAENKTSKAENPTVVKNREPGWPEDEFSEQEAAGNAETKINGLTFINQKLSKELDIAKLTLEEMTNEYTRVFSGQQTALEVENSHKRMLQIFHEAEKQLNQMLDEL